jgi:hypothetical protein
VFINLYFILIKVTHLTPTSLIKRAVLVTSVAAALSAATAFADSKGRPNLMKVKPSAVYHAIRGKSLADALAQVAQRSGITFKINTDLGQDVVSQTIAADNWNNAIKSLLTHYNFTTTQQGDTIKTVIITGRNHDAAETVTANTTASDITDIIVIEPRFKTLPAKYRDLPAGSVTAIDLPMAALMHVKDGSTITLDLPIGQYQVTHDHTVNEGDGSQTWVGNLSDEGEGYRVFLSQGASGTMGIVTTPDGTYNIESTQGVTYLIDTRQLQHAGYEGDSVVPSETMMGAIALNATQAQIDQLQAAADAAQKALDAANALVTQDTTLLTTAQTQLKTLQAAYNAATAKRDIAQNAYNAALAAYRAKPTTAGLAALNAANSTLTGAKNALTVASNAYQTPTANVNVLTTNLATVKAAAAKAQTSYNQAVTALNAARATPVTTTASGSGTNTTTAVSSKPVVDLMVLYTTVGQTAAYAKQRISLLVTASNQAYMDSGINMTLRLVYTEPTPYVENNANTQALTDLANGRGAFASISQKRSQYGADLVFLFRPLYAQTAGSCGTTYVEFAGGSLANKGAGYGTIGDGSSIDALKNYYCGINTFTHEVGHSLGLVHDREYSNFPGVFDYAYAWGVQGSFATIMSYKQPVLMYFSTPALATKCAGQACGYPETDKARSSDQSKSVNYTAPIIANFMATTVATPILK